MFVAKNYFLINKSHPNKKIVVIIILGKNILFFLFKKIKLLQC